MHARRTRDTDPPTPTRYRHLGRTLVREALAYGRAGVLASKGVRVRRESSGGSLGVVFVHGVGANSGQFAAMHEALRGDAEWFDAFEYHATITPIETLCHRLRDQLVHAAARCDRVVGIGHSLGGLLLRIILQGDRPPPRIAGWVSICAPLHGTVMSRLSPATGLRAIAPDSPLIEDLRSTAHRLDRWNGSILTVGARVDQFIAPHDSAFLEGHPSLLLEDAGHLSSLFDPRVHGAVKGVLAKVRGG